MKRFSFRPTTLNHSALFTISGRTQESYHQLELRRDLRKGYIIRQLNCHQLELRRDLGKGYIIRQLKLHIVGRSKKRKPVMEGD